MYQILYFFSFSLHHANGGMKEVIPRQTRFRQ